MSLAALIAPLLALFLVRKLLKSLGLGDLMKIGSAAMLPMAGAMKMGGESGRIGAATKGIKEAWSGKDKYDKNGNKLDRDKGLSDRLRLNKLEPKALAGSALAGGRKVGGYAVKKADPTGDRVAGLVGRRDADGNLIERGVAQRVLSLNSTYQRAKGAGVPGVDSKIGQSIGNILSKNEKSTARGKVDELQRQQRIDRLSDAKLEKDARRRLKRQYVPGVASQKAAAGRISAQQAAERLEVVGAEGPVALSPNYVSALKSASAAKLGIKAEDLLVGHDGTTVAPNVSDGVRIQGSPEATYRFATDPRNYLPEFDREMKPGEDEGDTLLRQKLLVQKAGLSDPVTGQDVDILAHYGFKITNAADLNEVIKAATDGVKGTRLEAIQVNVTAADRAAVDGTMREIKALRASEKAALVEAAKMELVTESNAMVSTVSAAPKAIASEAYNAANIVSQISSLIGVVPPTSAASKDVLSALNDTLTRVADTLAAASGEGRALLAHKSIAERDEQRPGGIPGAELAEIMERLNEQIGKLNAQKQGSQLEIAKLINAMQDAVARGDQAEVAALGTQISDFISRAESAAESESKNVTEALDKAKSEAEQREYERQRAQARFATGPYGGRKWTDNRGAGFQ